MSDYCLMPNEQFISAHHDKDKLHFDEMMLSALLDQHAELDFYSASSVKQQSVGRLVAPF